MKQDAGAEFIMTQLCYDVEQYKWWVDKIRKAGVTIPVDVGVMPVLQKEPSIRIRLQRQLNSARLGRTYRQIRR